MSQQRKVSIIVIMHLAPCASVCVLCARIFLFVFLSRPLGPVHIESMQDIRPRLALDVMLASNTVSSATARRRRDTRRNGLAHC